MSSSPAPGGRSRPLRVAGLALLGIAVGAVLVGLVTLGGQRGGGGNAAPTSGSPTSGQATSGPGSGSSSGGPSSSAAGAPSSASVPTTTATTTAAPPPPPTAPAPAPTAPIRVYNNSTIKGLAAQAADDFRRNGWQVDEVANYPNARIPTSTVYFRPGTDEEAAAQRLGARFNLRVEPRFEGIAGAKPGLIVIVTNDYGSK